MGISTHRAGLLLRRSNFWRTTPIAEADQIAMIMSMAMTITAMMTTAIMTTAMMIIVAVAETAMKMAMTIQAVGQTAAVAETITSMMTGEMINKFLRRRTSAGIFNEASLCSAIK